MCNTRENVSRPAIKSFVKRSESNVIGDAGDRVVKHLNKECQYWMHVARLSEMDSPRSDARNRDFSRELIVNLYKNARRQYLILKVYSYSARAQITWRKSFAPSVGITFYSPPRRN